MEIESISNYAKSTKRESGSLEYNLNLKPKKLNLEGTEYLIYFTTENKELIRIKYLKELSTDKLEMNFYYKEGKLIMATSNDLIKDSGYTIYRKNNVTIFECCTKDKPINNLSQLGLKYYNDYQSASL